ncbi:beta-glucanase (GH16 family) [Pseudonocardia hierapolitana]|uniref:Beta-glucanase (GH16 family) n=1 Tax=Pseudonocardia hierapolitana TaxID=1128676 RepID=A0A561SXI8_9PSEU|nr:glycoside hydrolase family 16 protein [Pseudonocardia hierapolitana]TWF79561.1 beta-glucanase (GH16 family) [Pseudonocardia hierapolitana]
MSRFPRRVCCALLGAVAVLVAGCGSPVTGEPDLFEALPAPSPAPTAVPAPLIDDARSPGSRHPGTAGDEWRLVFSDDFDGTRLDPTVWNRYNSVGGFGNGFRRPEAITVEDGMLRITARGNVSGGMNHERSQRYGRWEFRARTDKGRGRGSAILLWPDSLDKEADGELDMMEVPREDRSQAHFVIHYSAQNKLAGNKVAGDFSQWHTFAMDWLPNRITWYVDGVKQFETTDRNVIPTSSMHLAIQLDMGPFEEWILAPDETTPAEVSLEVDWVRVYARR